jgi:putative addiction module component (TIGR02574 family)
MPHSVPLPPPGFEQLSRQEKVDYIQALWDGLGESDIEVPEAHREILRERLADHLANPQEGRSWSDVRQDVERRLVERFGRR